MEKKKKKKKEEKRNHEKKKNKLANCPIRTPLGRIDHCVADFPQAVLGSPMGRPSRNEPETDASSSTPCPLSLPGQEPHTRQGKWTPPS